MPPRGIDGAAYRGVRVPEGRVLAGKGHSAYLEVTPALSDIGLTTSN